MAEDPNKAKRIEHYMAAGMSRTDAMLVDDLAVHASDQVIDVLSRVAATAPPHLRSMVMIISSKLLVVNLSEAIELLEEHGGSVFAALRSMDVKR